MSFITFITSYFQLKNNEKKSRKYILYLREKKFRKILKFAYKNSKFYHDLYSSHGISFDDLDTINIEKLPVIDKEVIMDNFDKLVIVDNVTLREIKNFLDINKTTNDLFKNKYHVIHSSGSSGKVGIFLYSKKDWNRIYPSVLRIHNLKLRRIKSVFFGATDGHYSSVSFFSWSQKGFLKIFNKSMILEIKKPIEEHIEKLNQFKPDVVCGYFSGLKILANYQENGLLKLSPNIILNTGEGINHKDKEYITRIFNAPMVNSYGISECGNFGIGKDEYGGIALNDDLVFVEIKEDHILITNLFNETQPLIRYRLEDYLTLSKNAPVDFPFTVVNEVIGRAESSIWFKNKDGKMDFIHPIVIAEFFVKGLDRHQIVLTGESSFDFLAVVNDAKTEEVVEKIRKKLDLILVEKNFLDVSYDVKVVESLNIDSKTGKFKQIIKK